MNKVIKLAVIGTVLAAGMACTNAKAVTTNVTYNLSVALTGVQRGTNAAGAVAKQVKVANLDILTALTGLSNSVTGSTNRFVASGKVLNKAKLIVVSTPGTEEATWLIKVRQVVSGTNVDTSVTNWIRLTQPVFASVTSKNFEYEILGLQIDSAIGIPNLDVSGFCTEGLGSLVGGKAPVVKLTNQTTSLTANVSGAGNLPEVAGATGTFAILGGSVKALGATIELH